MPIGCDHATRRVGEALLQEADPVDEGVGVAGEALGALVDEQVAVVARRLGGGCYEYIVRRRGTRFLGSVSWAVA